MTGFQAVMVSIFVVCMVALTLMGFAAIWGLTGIVFERLALTFAMAAVLSIVLAMIDEA